MAELSCILSESLKASASACSLPSLQAAGTKATVTLRGSPAGIQPHPHVLQAATSTEQWTQQECQVPKICGDASGHIISHKRGKTDTDLLQATMQIC